MKPHMTNTNNPIDFPEYKALDMITINDSKGNPYISIIDEEHTFHIQLHRYDARFRSKILVHLDKKCLPELIRALEKMENW